MLNVQVSNAAIFAAIGNGGQGRQHLAVQVPELGFGIARKFEIRQQFHSGLLGSTATIAAI